MGRVQKREFSTNKHAPNSRGEWDESLKRISNPVVNVLEQIHNKLPDNNSNDPAKSSRMDLRHGFPSC
jgi:hypothetical protein